MTDWESTCLTAAAAALVVMAVIQIAVLVVMARLAKQAMETTKKLQQDIAPLLEKAHGLAEKAHRIADDASRMTALTLRQVERVDEFLARTAEQVDDTLAVVRSSIVEPIRQGTAFVTGLRAVFDLVRGWRQRRSEPVLDDEDGMFIG